MIQIVCSRSGLTFEAENRRKKVHPEISYWTTHRDLDVRRKAVAVIEQGKAEGWDSIEQFEAEIQKALNPEPPPRPSYNFEGAWVARITGSHSAYRFNREFLEAVDREGRFKRFDFQGTDGIYECCYKSNKGNESRSYYQVKDGQLHSLQLEDVERLFPESEIAPQISIEDCVATDYYLGKVGETVEWEGQVFTVVRVDESTRTVSEWNDFEDEYETSKESVYKTWLKPVSAEEAAQFLEAKRAADAAKAAKNQAIARLREIAKSIKVANGAISPQSAAFPAGSQFVVRQGHFQANELLILESYGNRLWSLVYNGRDGDDWSFNNVSSTYIGCYLEISSELKAEVEELLSHC